MIIQGMGWRGIKAWWLAALLLGASGTARAQDETLTSSDGWQFQLSPYLWAAGLQGDVGTRSNLPTVKVDADFDDIISDTDFALMLAGDARHGRFGVLGDLVYLSLSDSNATPGGLFGGVEADMDTTFLTVAPYYRAIDDRSVALDVFAGGRLWYVDTKIKALAGRLPERSDGESQTWLDPILGVRGQAVLGRGFSITASADAGGFGVGSEFTWQLVGTVDYEIRDWISVRAGYRHLDVDYKEDGFTWDVALSGPIVGVTFRF